MIEVNVIAGNDNPSKQIVTDSVVYRDPDCERDEPGEGPGLKF